MLEQARRFDEASAMLDRAERLARAQGSDVTLQRAVLLSRTKDWRDGLALLDAEPPCRVPLCSSGGACATALVGELTAFFTPDRFAALTPAPIRDDVPQPIFILGFPRSGTTLTEQVLASPFAHPRRWRIAVCRRACRDRRPA